MALVLAVANWPVARARADYVNLLEEGALVPVQADLRDLSCRVEVHDMDLCAVSGPSVVGLARAHSHHGKDDGAVRDKIVI